MPSLVLSNLAFAYSDSVPLLGDVSLHLSSGWTGVVGPNGSGKTTFLRLVAAELEPDEGQIRLEPAGAQRLLCPQRVDCLGADIERFAADPSGEAQRLHGTLRLEPRDLARWDTLSPGERKRWQVGAALAAQPAVLLLDEPTNHLDIEARDLLLDALHRYDGIGLVVSHDRSLLNALTSGTLRIRLGGAKLWKGAYDAARADWQADERRLRSEHASVRSEARKLRRRLADARGRRAQAEGRQRTSRRMKGAKDSDARLRFKAKRRRSAEVSLGREVGKTRRRLAREQEKLASFRFDKKLGRSLFVDYTPAPMAQLLEVDARELRAGDRILLRDLKLAVRRDSRLWVRGPNGAGKTTLLRALLQGSHVPASRVLWVPQELGPEQEIALLQSVRSLDPEARGRVLSLVAALGVNPETLMSSEAPSPGEGRKLAIADGLGRQVWALLLDEPTNHLDLESIERLEAALAEYPGALVLVTHDEALASATTDTVWELRGQHVEIRAGPDAP
jgi:ATPase subunit of ABC transporter with duplicated ATPase domains